jgi:prepilin-type processing-associated H-X9-DG protein
MGDSNSDLGRGYYIYPERNTWAGANWGASYAKVRPLRHQNGDNYVFADGHAKWYTEEGIRDKAWRTDGIIPNKAGLDTLCGPAQGC